MSTDKRDERNRKNERGEWSINSGGGSNVYVKVLFLLMSIYIQFININISSMAWL
jgi:hypothetical protein